MAKKISWVRVALERGFINLLNSVFFLKLCLPHLKLLLIDVVLDASNFGRSHILKVELVVVWDWAIFNNLSYLDNVEFGEPFNFICQLLLLRNGQNILWLTFRFLHGSRSPFRSIDICWSWSHSFNWIIKLFGSSNGFSLEFVETFLEIVSDLTKFEVCFVEQETVGDDQFNISIKLVYCKVFAVPQVGCDSPKIHRVLHNINIVRNAHCKGVNGFEKGPGVFIFF